jgi:hypothetical protein
MEATEPRGLGHGLRHRAAGCQRPLLFEATGAVRLDCELCPNRRLQAAALSVVSEHGLLPATLPPNAHAIAVDNGGPRVCTSIAALPRLGSSFAVYALRFPLQRPVTTRNGRLSRTYDADYGPLSILFDRGFSVAQHLPFGRPAPCKANLQSLQAALAPADGSKP